MTDSDAAPSGDDPIDRLRADPHLGPVVEAHGPVTVEPADDPFARFVVAIVNQQLSTQSAAAIRERLFDRFEVTPAVLLSADDEALREVGLSGQKIEYVRNVAEAYQSGKVSPERYAEFTDEAVVDDLTEIKGVGEWTAHIFLMFVLGREDVFPVGDLGIRTAMAALFGMDRSDRAAMVETAERWAPYRSYASLYLWRSVD